MDLWIGFLTLLSSIEEKTLLLFLLTSLISLIAALIAERSRYQAILANELPLLPVLIVSIENVGSQNMRLVLKNVGQGVAYDIKIEDYYHSLIIKDDYFLYRLILSLNKDVKILEAGRFCNLKSQAYRGTIELESFKEFLIANLKYSKTKIVFAIVYKNILGKKYYTLIETSERGINIVKPPTYLGIFGRTYLLSRKIVEILRIECDRNIVFWLYKKGILKKI